MIDFKPITLSQKEAYTQHLHQCGQRGCEYSFANLYMWGRQRCAMVGDYWVFFSQFNRKTVYPFPLGQGDIRPVVDAIIHDARQRDIPCRITGLNQEDCATLERLYPGKFRYHFDRDGFDYIYAIDDLADLKGRKYQRKRNHLNRFRDMHPDYVAEPITEANLAEVEALLERWYTQQEALHPHSDFHMEKAALKKALAHRERLSMEGLALRVDGQLIAMTMGSPLSGTTFDIHFEKALQGEDGAYAAINCEFSRFLRERYPNLQWLDREEDMGLEGLRKAKMSYYPAQMVEKNWACLLEDEYDY